MLIYYTDGSASPNPGPGGFAVIMGDKPVVLGSEPDGSAVKATNTTNIRMEGYAILEALKHSAGEPCTIYTDSEFWINVLTKWAPGWEAKGWHKKGGIKNLDIVQELYPLYQNSQAPTLTWVRGHMGDKGNELADHWANEARRGARL